MRKWLLAATLTLCCTAAFGQLQISSPFYTAAIHKAAAAGGGGGGITADALGTNAQPFGTACTVPIVIGGAANMVVVAALFIDSSSAVALTATPTCGGVAMTYVTNVVSGSGAQGIEIWRLVNPSAGSQNVIWGWNNTCPASSVVRSWSGVDQTTPVYPAPSPQVSTNSAGTSLSCTVSSATGEKVVDWVCVNDAVTLAPGASQTTVFNNSVNTGDSTISVTEKDGAASVVISTSWTGAKRCSQVAINLNAF